MKLYILFILLVTTFQFTASQLALAGNDCPTQCNLASVIPQDGTSITLGPAYSTVYVNAANLVSIMGNIITVTPAQPTWTVGTVVVLYQATGATVNISDPTSREYGTILSIGNAGNWEIIKIGGIIDQSTFVAGCNLVNSYDASLTTVVEPIRAEQITLLEGVQIVPTGLQAGNASILNGVVPVIGNIINMGPGSSISATGKGFLGGLRGGVNTSILCMDCATTCKQLDYSYTDNTWGGRRGGSIAGNIDESFGRGAIANGGGGGNNHNAAGGGGANGWSDATGVWTGDGVMNTAWTAGWKLETSVLAKSIGGGRGGYSFSALKQDPLAVPPGDCQWQGNSRLNNGGLGGRPIKYFQGFQTYEKLFFGGGGGAGHENDWVGGSGGDGGGFAIVIANQIIASSAASIQANGNPGQSSIPIATGPFDGSGGGGAGGSVFVVAYESLSSNVQISAAGGKGGDNNALSTEEAEGGAGGGGGGVVSVAVPDASPNPCSSANVAGGLSGYQNGQTFFLTFRPNGGTDGNNGQCLAVTTAPPCITTGSPTMSPSVSSSGAATVSASSKNNGGTSIVGGGAPSSGRTSGGGGKGGSSNNGGKGNRTPSPHNKKNSRPSNNNHKNHNNNNDDESASSFVGINSCMIVVISLLVLLLQVQLY